MYKFIIIEFIYPQNGRMRMLIVFLFEKVIFCNLYIYRFSKKNSSWFHYNNFSLFPSNKSIKRESQIIFQGVFPLLLLLLFLCLPPPSPLLSLFIFFSPSPSLSFQMILFFFLLIHIFIFFSNFLFSSLSLSRYLSLSLTILLFIS